MHGLTWPAKRGHVAHAHDGGNKININEYEIDQI